MQIFYTVKEGDTIDSIAAQFNIPPNQLIQDNILDNDQVLNVGQVLVIAPPAQTYTVREGDTLYDIADAQGISVAELLRNNPFLSDRTNLMVGEELVIRYDKQGRPLNVNGMAFSFIDEEVLIKTLPFLTYITIMGYRVDMNGALNDLDDTRVIQTSLQYGVVPLMLVYGVNDTGQGDPSLSHTIFNNTEVQNRFLENIIAVLSTKGYYGAIFGFQYVLEEDRENYTNFIVHASDRLHELGYLSGAVMIPNTFGYVRGEPYMQTYYSRIGSSVDGIILLSYQWSTSYIPEVYQTTYDYMKDYVEFAVTQIPPEKIYLGISRVAYDWELPYVEGQSFVASLTDPNALALANRYGSEIFFDEVTQTPYFEYNVSGRRHLVWFRDLRYINAMLKLVEEYGLGGISIWNIMYYYRIYLIINAGYPIVKVLPED